MSENKPIKILVSAGEPSGDDRLRQLIRGSDDAVGSRPVEWVGMCADVEGVRELFPRPDIAVMGLFEVFRVLATLLRVRRKILEAAVRERPTAALLVDFGGFHIGLAKKLRRLGIPVFYYAPPKIWAWGAWRVPKLRRAVDALGEVFPFARDFYKARGFEVAYTGHPLADVYADLPTRDDARQAVAQQVDTDTPGYGEAKGSFLSGGRTILVMPGSRRQEVTRHMPVLASAMKQADETLGANVYVVVYQRQTESGRMVRTWAESLAEKHQVLAIGTSGNPQIYCSADYAWIASGTANLEAALSQLPATIFYMMNAVTATLAKLVIQVDMVSPANLFAGRIIYPELLLADFTPTALIQQTKEYFQDPQTQNQIDQSLAEIRTLAGQAGAAQRMGTEFIRWLRRVGAYK